jgi:radical SAM superfamily enzyme YgiQ (UPF0313 family)
MTMKILLSTIPANDTMTPLALLYLKAVLLKDRRLKSKIDVEVKEFLPPLHSDDHILQEIQRYKPDIIGFSCYIWNTEKILLISKKIKKNRKDIKIVLGGSQVSPIAESILEKNPHIDVVVRGEGEITFLELVRAFSSPEKGIAGVQGITYRNKNRIVNNPDRKIIPDLDAIPSFYLFDSADLENREVCLETQRGCAFKCHFCYYHKNFDTVRSFSMKRVKKDLVFLLKKKLKAIYLMDPVFNMDVDRAKEISRFIVRHNKRNIMFHTEIRAELVDEELADLFRRANITNLEVGLQSSDSNVLRCINRKWDEKKFINGINLCNKYKLGADVQLILGLPGDTVRSFRNSLEFILSLGPKKITVFNLQVLPGTRIWDDAVRMGIVFEKEPPYQILQTRDISFDEMIYLRKIIKSLDMFRARRVMKFLCRETGMTLLDLIESWVKWLGDNRSLLKHPPSNWWNNKLKKFIKFLCERQGIDFNFYEILLKKD